MKIRVLCVAGARPNFMKVAPVMRAFAACSRFEARIVHTGQHYDAKLSQIFFEQLGMPAPSIHLGVGSASHAVQTAEIMKGFETVVAAEQPHCILVVGDVNSTIACALVAAKLPLRDTFHTCWGPRRRPVVVHVEAGLRSFDDDMPEEINRKLTDRVSDVLYVSEPAGVTNLTNEGVSPDRVVLVGNVMIDTLLAAREQAMASPVLEELGLTPRQYGVVTLHRPSNVDDPGALAELIGTLDHAARELPLVFPIHPRTEARLDAMGLVLDQNRWRVCEPVGYLEFLKLLSSARVVLTDSGGIQEETTVLGVPCVTLRENTERPATVDEGTNQLAGVSRDAVMQAFRKAMSGAVSGRVPRFWDGKAATRIVQHLEQVFREPNG